MHEFVNSQMNQIILCLLKVKKCLVVQSDSWVIESLVIDVTNLCVCACEVVLVLDFHMCLCVCLNWCSAPHTPCIPERLKEKTNNF